VPKKTDAELRKWIDEATYEEMFRKRRFAPIGDPFFCHDEVGDYFVKVMGEKEDKTTHDERVAISKRVDWDASA
jgi:hypothetical protein